MLPSVVTEAATCCWATPPSAAAIKLNRSSKNNTVKKACGIVLTGLLPPGCMAVINPGTLLGLVVMAEALFFTKPFLNHLCQRTFRLFYFNIVMEHFAHRGYLNQ